MKYSNFIKINKTIDLGTYYNLYDEEFNFLERFDKKDLPKILDKYNIKFQNLKFNH